MDTNIRISRRKLNFISADFACFNITGLDIWLSIFRSRQVTCWSRVLWLANRNGRSNYSLWYVKEKKEGRRRRRRNDNDNCWDGVTLGRWLVSDDGLSSHFLFQFALLTLLIANITELVLFYIFFSPLAQVYNLHARVLSYEVNSTVVSYHYYTPFHPKSTFYPRKDKLSKSTGYSPQGLILQNRGSVKDSDLHCKRNVYIFTLLFANPSLSGQHIANNNVSCKVDGLYTEFYSGKITVNVLNENKNFSWNDELNVDLQWWPYDLSCK